MQFLFFNNAGVLRSGWRVTVYLFAFILSAFILSMIGQTALASLQVESAPGTNIFLVSNAFLSLVAAIVTGWLCARYLESLPFRSLGASFSNGYLRHLLIGIILGSATLGLAVFIAFIFGGLRFSLNSASPLIEIAYSLAVSLLVFGVAAAFEEVLFRGYILQTFARAGFAWLAIILTSSFFCLVHVRNPNSDLISSTNTLLAGVWFGIAYLKTRDLWFVWGLHLMWNWTQGSVFGIEVSGITSVTAFPLLKEIDHGPTWLTGQEYGIEGGIACTIAILLSGVLIYVLPGLKADPEMLGLTNIENDGSIRT
ncbi:type II CAAX endopeptidase family protein [soil metagenome]